MCVLCANLLYIGIAGVRSDIVLLCSIIRLYHLSMPNNCMTESHSSSIQYSTARLIAMHAMQKARCSWSRYHL